MRSGVILAILASLVLVVGAFWYRFQTPDSTPDLVAVTNQNSSDEAYYNELFSNFSTATSSTSQSAPSEPRTGTELIGRQLMLDYLNLAGSGQATEANLMALADQYVNTIPTLNYAPRATYADLVSVANTLENFRNYSEGLGRIYQKHAGAVTDGAKNMENVTSTITNAHYAYLKKAGLSYTEQAVDLKNLPVPQKLLESHLKLVNLHLSSGAALKAFSETENDPASGFAGILILNQNLEEEAVVLQEIASILKSNGI